MLEFLAFPVTKDMVFPMMALSAIAGWLAAVIPMKLGAAWKARRDSEE